MANKKTNIKSKRTTKKVVRKKRAPKKTKGLSKTMKSMLIGMSAVVCGFAIWEILKKKGMFENITTREEVFDIITENCSSMGVNKMEIVDKICDKIFSERKKRKDAEFKVTELEAKIITITERLEQVTKFAKGEKTESEETKENKNGGA